MSFIERQSQQRTMISAGIWKCALTANQMAVQTQGDPRLKLLARALQSEAAMLTASLNGADGEGLACFSTGGPFDRQPSERRFT